MSYAEGFLTLGWSQDNPTPYETLIPTCVTRGQFLSLPQLLPTLSDEPFSRSLPVYLPS